MAKQVSKIAFFGFSVLLLISFTILAFLQGVIIQLGSDLAAALIYYFVAALSLSAAALIYIRARAALKVVEYSELHR